MRDRSNDAEYVVATARDVTDARRGRSAIVASDEPYRLLFENNPQPMWVFDRETLRFLEVNEAAVASYGYSRDEFLSMSICDIRPPEDVPEVLEMLESWGEGLTRAGMWRHCRADKSSIVVDVTSYPTEFRGRRAVLSLGIDVTERVLATRALVESEERYREMFQADLTGNYISTASGRLVACNETFARIFGFDSVEAAIAAPTDSLYDDIATRDAFVEAIRSRKKIDRHEVTLRRRDGSAVFVLESAVGTFDGEGNLVQIKGFLFDNTQHKQLEEQYRQAQKMEAIGRLAGGIAHDFNNVLTVIAGYAEFLAKRLPSEAALRDEVEQIQGACRKATDLTRQLLAFSRKQVLRPKAIDVNAIVGGIEKMLRVLVGEGVAFDLALGSDVWFVKADPSQIEQVVLNLVTNARDALAGSGRLRIQTSNAVVEDDFAGERGAMAAGEYVTLSVSDTGTGMDEAARARVFEPFFTTKEIGRGTGLGLATVYGIVKQSGGYIWVHSRPGSGTAIDVYLPRTKESPDAALSLVVSPSSEGSETILLVEDEASVRRLAAQSLRMAGYNVIEAANGPEGLEAAERMAGTIDILVSDVVMPGLNGRQLAHMIKATRPETRILLMSGYAGDSIFDRGVLDRGTSFLEKPFTPATLVAKVRKVLDAPSD